MTGELYRTMWTVGVGAALGVACLTSCGSEGTPSSASPEADSGRTAPPDSGAALSADSTAASPADATAPPRGPCPNPAIPEGELQNRATGPSVFGQVVGDEVGWFDALGGTECGLPGVRICQLGTDLCTESDEAGQFVLGGLPEGQDIDIALEKPGCLNVLRLVHTAATPINLRQTRLLDYDSALALFDRAGVTVDAETQGSLVGIAIAAGEAIGGLVLPEGVKMTLQPSGPAPLYSLGSETPGGPSSDEVDPTLEATRFGGWGLFVNVPPGDYRVRFERNGELCDQALPGYGYGADAEGNIRVKIIAGWSTSSIAAFCP